MRALATLSCLAAAATLLCSCGSPAPPPGSRRITARIVDFGVFRNELPSRAETDSNAMHDLEVLTHTNLVTLTNGMRFGFTFEVHGFSSGEKVTLTQMVRRPMTVLMERREETIASTLPPFVASGQDDRGAVTYQLGGTNGLTPGIYRIELWYRGHMLTGKAFVVLKQKAPKPNKRVNRVATLDFPEQS